jgi:hypothetical protein
MRFKIEYDPTYSRIRYGVAIQQGLLFKRWHTLERFDTEADAEAFIREHGARLARHPRFVEFNDRTGELS